MQPIRWSRAALAHGSRAIRTLFPAAALLFVGGLLACGRNEYSEPPPPSVTAQRPIVRDVIRYSEFTGTTRSVESVALRAQVKGVLKEMHFKPGDHVEQGQLLFTIDPKPFQVALDSAQAQFESHEAAYQLAQTAYDCANLMSE
ncbi:MAG: biotin/lipoyl-binding protein, partial [Deltaproteobacteria bacterium]|nr:biotin/lipoyl-binding protein [Deltaproteobacteria bacterium]